MTTQTNELNVDGRVHVVGQSIERGPRNFWRTIELVVSHDTLYGRIAGIKL